MNRAFPEEIIEAGDGSRTRDPQLGKLMLYQLSYSRSLVGGLALSRDTPLHFDLGSFRVRKKIRARP
jgi:hypothetical protein